MTDDLINITPLCSQNHKKASHFLDNPRIIRLIEKNNYTVQTKSGRYNGGTWISIDLYPEFLLWVSEDTREDILSQIEF